nr:MAG TPA: hypothetical protein [Caudoviricetes sp.]
MGLTYLHYSAKYPPPVWLARPVACYGQRGLSFNRIFRL